MSTMSVSGSCGAATVAARALGCVCCSPIFSKLSQKEASLSHGPFIVFALTDTMDAYDSGRLKQLLKDAGVTIA